MGKKNNFSISRTRLSTALHRHENLSRKAKWQSKKQKVKNKNEKVKNKKEITKWPPGLP